MSCFTHLQPAQPSTLGHYLAGVGAELARSADSLAATFEAVNRSPMGAAAGAGTSFPIDREQVALWLGFSGVIENSLDAVASRDYLVQILSQAAMAGSTLTRWAGDFQLWGSHAYRFLGWPDELVSTSSIMPQKRNAFVLENIRGQAVQPAAALAHALMAVKSTPFSNGVEVSAESTAFAWPSLRAARKAMRLMTLLLQGLEVDSVRMRAFLDSAETTMTALADLLVARYGLAFRTAHDAVGSLLRELPRGAAEDAELLAARLEEILAAAVSPPPRLDRAAVSAALDPARAMAAARYGGGPAPESVDRQLSALASGCARLRERIASWRQQLKEADRGLAAEMVAAVAAVGVLE
jgi:argininosuccinate lyase